MGFNEDNYEGGSGKFANFKDGKLVTKIGGEKKTFGSLTGQIVDLDIVDEKYNGNEYRKVILFIAHESGVTQLGFPLASGYGWGFFQMCGNINVAHELEISGGIKTDPNDKTKKYGSMFIKQDGTNLKHLMTKDSDAGKKVPKVEEVKVGKTVVKNYEKRDTYMEKVLTAFYKKVQKQFPNGAAAFKGAKHQDVDTNNTEPIDDLPF